MSLQPFAPASAVIPQYLDQLPADEQGLTGAAGVTVLQAAIANRNSARCTIPVIGDSVTEGQGATAFTSRWIAQANRAARAAYPTTANGSSGGQGFIPIAGTGESTFTWPVTTFSGSTGGGQPIGPVRSALSVSSAGSWTWTAPAGTTSCRIMYYANGGGDQFSYQVAAGGPVTVTDSSNTGDGTLTASITIAGGQVLTVAWVSGTVYMEGIIHYAGDESSGITFHGCGHYGWNAGTGASGWTQAGYGPGFPWYPAIAALATAAYGIMLGINDASTGNGNYTAAQFQANLEALVAYLQQSTALAALPLLLIIPYQPSETFTSGSWAPYAAAIRSVSAAVPASRVIDLNYRLPTVASGFDGGALYYDQYHPTNLGHALIGEIAAASARIA